MTDRPRLAVFHNLPSGGGIRVVSGMVEHLAKDFRITVHSPEGSSSPVLIEDIEVREWPFPEGGRLSGLKRAAAPLALPARLRALKRLCGDIAGEIDNCSDIALVHNSMYVAAPPVLSFLSIPSVYFCYEFPRHIYEPSLVRRTDGMLRHMMLSRLRSLERRMDMEAALNASSVATLSTWMKNRIRDIYGLEAAVVRPGVDTGFWMPVKAERTGTVLSIGALWPFKGHETVIETLSHLPSNIRPSLTVVADREYPGYAERLRSAAEGLGVDLDILRSVSDGRLRELYCSASAVLCCQWNEPYGLVPLEAMACGTPVIAVREGGFTDNLRDGRNGILVDRDPHKLAAALERLLSKDELRGSLAGAGRDFVTVERTAAAAAESLSALLRNAVECGESLSSRGMDSQFRGQNCIF